MACLLLAGVYSLVGEILSPPTLYFIGEESRPQGEVGTFLSQDLAQAKGPGKVEVTMGPGASSLQSRQAPWGSLSIGVVPPHVVSHPETKVWDSGYCVGQDLTGRMKAEREMSGHPT